MTSAALALAARTNGKKSRGPKTPEGKGRSSANSHKHGLYAKTIHTDAECDAEYRRLFAALNTEFQPATPFAESLTHTIALALARSRWANRTIAAMVNAETEAHPNPEAPFLTRIFRSYESAAGPLDILHRLDRRFHREWTQALEHLEWMHRFATEKMKERTESEKNSPAHCKANPNPEKSQHPAAGHKLLRNEPILHNPAQPRRLCPFRRNEPIPPLPAESANQRNEPDSDRRPDALVYDSAIVSADLFPALDQLLESHDPGATLDFLIDRFTSLGEYGLLFEARLMKNRHELGLPLIQTDSVTDERYQSAVVEAAREAGRLFLASGNIERAWPYFRAISETDPVADAIGRLEPREGLDGVIGIAFQEGVHPLKGLELIIAQHGMCRAITAFGMQAVTKDRDKCIALLATSLHREILERMGRAIALQEGDSPAPERSLPELMAGRDWLFGEWDYYVDTSHLISVLPYCVEVKDHAVLNVFHELCEYGKRLSPRFHSAGNPPFENQYEAYDHYIQALRGNDVDEHLAYFRRQARECDAETVGDAPGRTLVKLLVALDRPAEALDVLLRDVFEDAPYGIPVPSALQLCYRARDFARMTELARDRGDLLSYAAARIMGAS